VIAYLIVHGYSVPYIAKKLKMSESRIYHLVSDKDSPINVEINRFLNELFMTTERRLMILYDKALQELDKMLSSSDEEKQYRAMDRIIKMFFARTAKNAIIQQYFCASPQSQQIGLDIDNLIIQKRIERGLEKPPDYKDSSASAPDTSAPDTSAPDTSAPDASAPDTSAPDASAPEYRAFIELLKG
jgi:hypothetical protein